MAHRSLHIINARLPGRDNLWQIQTNNGRIQAMATMTMAIAPAAEPPASLETLDVEGDWISLGGIDLQINGALGLAFPDLTTEHHDQLAEIGKFLWAQGVDAYLPTLVTTSIDKIHRALAALAQFSPCPPDPTASTAQILGAHLEGPFLNAEKRGAHPQEHLLPLTLEQVKRVLGEHGSGVKLITLAPELDPGGTVIPFLTSQGIAVSLGHSQATVEQAQQAFQQGATLVTHAFNAMPGLHHREPGLLGAALAHPQVSCGFIADGQHICPTMLDLLLRIDRGDPATLIPHPGLFLVSDALAPLGLPDGVYPWDTRQIEVCAGTARLPDGTLAGTTLPLLAGAQNLVKWGFCEPGEAIALATIAPRRAIGLPALEVGQPAHLLRWHLQNETRTLTWQRV